MDLDLLATIGSFQEWERELFFKALRIRLVEKDEIILKKGDVASSVFFVQKGSLYQFLEHKDAADTIIDLHLENEWAFNYKSFISQQPSDANIRAYSKSEVGEISIESIHFLISRSLSFLKLNQIMDPAVSRISFFDHSATPLEKYLHILQTRPKLIQSFPLKMIAAYLKISPETLSRVREKLVRPKSIS